MESKTKNIKNSLGATWIHFAPRIKTTRRFTAKNPAIQPNHSTQPFHIHIFLIIAKYNIP